MTCNVQRGAACLPVTALHPIKHGDLTLVLYNEGSWICTRHASSHEVVCRRRIFRSQNIHGIVSSPGQQDGHLLTFYIVVWGGRMVCICKLVLDTSNHDSGHVAVHINVISRRTIEDWIMTVVVDVKDSSALILTAHNALWRIGLAVREPPSLDLVGQGMQTLLYSGAIVVSTKDTIIVASGTIFGEVIQWACHRPVSSTEWKSVTKHIFLGHRGSIFGVTISELILVSGKQRRFLASCSDDRTIRIWNIDNCDLEAVDISTKQPTSIDTGFGAGRDDDLQLAMAWGHSSRIWGVYFPQQSTISNNVVRLVSRGEDGVCQTWTLRADGVAQDEGIRGSLMPDRNDRHHAGKNAWSLAMINEIQGIRVYTGGADGQIVSRLLSGHDSVIQSSIAFQDIINSIKPCAARAIKQYLGFKNGAVIATTETGGLVRSHIADTSRWVLLFEPGERSTTTLCTNHAYELAFYCLADGSLCAYDTTTRSLSGTIHMLPSQATWLQVADSTMSHNHDYEIQLVANLYGTKLYGDTQPRLITVKRANDRLATSARIIQLPSDFVITSTLYLRKTGALICGSRAGAIAIFTKERISEQLDNSSIIRHVHGSDAVTSIVDLSQTNNEQFACVLHLLTTGRDGTFAVHRVSLSLPELDFVTIHRATPPFGPNIEGAHITSHGTVCQRVVLYGFRSTEFVVWDESNQTRLLSVDCGGPHRSWNYMASDEGSGHFWWTKAGKANACPSFNISHSVLQYGGHGREIKALAISPGFSLLKHVEADVSPTTLIATGAEDTAIRLFNCTSTSFIHVAVLKQHTTGLQALTFSPCGSYLFSSGGVEEFLVWKLDKIPILNIGAVIVGSLSKHDGDDDARIMSVDVIEQGSQIPRVRTFTISMAYSNGKAKVFEFHHDPRAGTGTFRLLQQIHVGTLCLTQARLLAHDSSTSMLVGATDGKLRHADLDVTKSAVNTHCVHQSNIAAMAALKFSTNTYLIATGGDDNALGITLFQLGDAVVFETILVPKAHAAALTAVAVVSTDVLGSGESITVISAGNDQRVQVWQVSISQQAVPLSAKDVTITHSSNNSNCLQLKKVGSFSTDVADVSALEVVKHSQTSDGDLDIEVMVVGVGMQVIKFGLSR